MRRSTDPEDLLYDSEIEKTARQLRKATRQQRDNLELDLPEVTETESVAVKMAEEHQQRTLADYNTPIVEGCGTSIVRPPIGAHNFELKPALLNLVSQDRFGGGPMEDPHAHISRFLLFCDTFKAPNVSEDAIRLRVFPFSLRDHARHWLENQPIGSITTWEDLLKKFLTKYFPPAKSAKLRSEIAAFFQADGESLYEAWERYKELLRKCPHHGFNDWMLLQTFYNGLTIPIRTLVDAAAGGSLFDKTPDDAQQLIETMALSSCQSRDRRVEKKGGLIEVDNLTAMLAQQKLITQQLASLTQQMNDNNKQVSAVNSAFPNRIPIQDFSHFGQANSAGEGFLDGAELQEQVNYMGGQPRNQGNQYYNPGWRNHPNFSWNNQGGPRPYAPNQYQTSPHVQPNQDKPSNLEVAMEKLQQSTTAFVNRTEKFMTDFSANYQNHDSQIRNLEAQIEQISKQLSERTPGSFPSDTLTNPKEQWQHPLPPPPPPQ